MEFLTIGAGVVLILLGMRHLRQGLDQLFGARLIGWLQAMTVSRLRAFAAGMLAGAIAPSSTSLAVLSVRLMDQASLPAVRMLAVLLGANVGITITVQLLALRLDRFAAVLLLAGGCAYLFLKRPRLRGSGQVLLAFGLIFLAMQLIGQAAATMTGDPNLTALFALSVHWPWLIALAAAVLTAALQSSTASIALALALASAGLLPTATLIPWVIGTNLGTALTILAAGWTSTEGRRLGVGNLLLRAVVALPLMLAAEPLSAFATETLALTPARQAADLHTGFNLLVGLLALPLLAKMGALLEYMVPSPPGTQDNRSRLTPTLLQSPTLALNLATRESFRIIDNLRWMLQATRTIAEERKPDEFIGIDRTHDRVAALHRDIVDYVGQISDEHLSPADARWKFYLIDYTQELEAASLILRRDLTDTALRQQSAGVVFPEPYQRELGDLTAMLQLHMEQVTHLLMTRDPEFAGKLLGMKQEFSRRCRRCQRDYHRQHRFGGVPDPGAMLSDHLNCMRRVNSHLCAIAHLLLEQPVAGPDADDNYPDPEDPLAGGQEPPQGAPMSAGGNPRLS